MSTPEEALEQARRSAAERVAAGGYREADVQLTLSQDEGVSRERLMRFALIEPDPDLVYSTRRGPVGRTVTRLKQGLIRSLRQYNTQVHGQQTRFNLHITSYVTALEQRVAELEAELRKR